MRGEGRDPREIGSYLHTDGAVSVRPFCLHVLTYIHGYLLSTRRHPAAFPSCAFLSFLLSFFLPCIHAFMSLYCTVLYRLLPARLPILGMYSIVALYSTLCSNFSFFWFGLVWARNTVSSLLICTLIRIRMKQETLYS